MTRTPALLLAALAAGTTWVTLLSWRVLTSEAAARPGAEAEAPR